MSTINLILECLTNMHAGNGDINYNIIDNEVERDPVTNYPTVNASGVKGALRVFLKGNAKENEWFGASGDSGSDGKLKILAANLLAMPVRATEGNAAYYLLASQEMIEQYKRLTTALGLANRLSSEQATEKTIAAEGIELKKYVKFGDKEIYIVGNDEFAGIDLPVLARNKVGENKNLWYEEVVSHESIFYVPVVADDSDQELLKAFADAVNGKVVQFGGNASIGYGLCKVTAE